MILKKQTNFTFPNHIKLDLIDSPDIAQTIAVTCFGLGISCDLFGLHTLKIKETDRLYALKKELIKLGADAYSTENSFHLKSSENINQNIKICILNGIGDCEYDIKINEDLIYKSLEYYNQKCDEQL